MKSAVCTLFEGDYHLGAAALVNSLHASGFRGQVFCGLRGPLPPWAGGADRLAVAKDLEVVFLPQTTGVHFTNHKPTFLLDLWRGPAAGADSLFYFDPDIVVTARWSYFTEWCQAGIALCEDVNSPLSAEHPRRVGWRRHFLPRGFPLRFREAAYVNGGCFGSTDAALGFLELWRDLQAAMADAIGGLEQSKLREGTSPLMRDPLFCFNASDQDALNAAIEAAPPSVRFSILGREAMAFWPGLSILPHALGSPKPWQRHLLREAFAGRPPTTAEKAFWRFAAGPLAPFSKARLRRSRAALALAAFLGRFYRRN